MFLRLYDALPDSPTKWLGQPGIPPTAQVCSRLYSPSVSFVAVKSHSNGHVVVTPTCCVFYLPELEMILSIFSCAYLPAVFYLMKSFPHFLSKVVLLFVQSSLLRI